MKNLMNRNIKMGLTLCVAAVLSTSCGAFMGKITGKSGDSDGAAGTTTTEEKNNGEANPGVDLTKLTVLTSSEMAKKIFDALGRNMTITSDGKMNYDYLIVNATNFTGSISSDPTNRFASQFSIGFFLALAGLSDVVGKNYNSGLFSGAATNDCRKLEGAKKIISVIAPGINDADCTNLAKDLVDACALDPSSAVAAAIQSYPFATKTAISLN